VECCLVPQLANARRMGCDLAPYPALLELEGRCLALEAFQRASPERQPDYLPD
ncbi:maleylacetoacetate isomerase, partial [Pseudomonas aeruginosa]|nr:maleylacetoacetate isomerase [Pseudomonas aeruginosa]